MGLENRKKLKKSYPLYYTQTAENGKSSIYFSSLCSEAPRVAIRDSSQALILNPRSPKINPLRGPVPRKAGSEGRFYRNPLILLRTEKVCLETPFPAGTPCYSTSP